jgi:hypothetical protein
MSRRVLLGLRLAVLAGLLLAAVGVAGHVVGASGARAVGGTWLTTALGPTAYVLLAHPRSVTSRLRNAVVGHVAGVLAGLLALAVFGLWSAPSIVETHRESLAQVGAQGVAIALTLLVLTVADAHHAPAGATTLLVASGIARPGPELVGLLIGLAIVLALAPLLARLPGERRDTATADAEETPMG